MNKPQSAEISDKTWYVYMVVCKDTSLYTGITNKLEARIEVHNQGRGAKYTRARRPVKLCYSEKMEDRSAALKREYQIKALSRAQKLALIDAAMRASLI